MCAIAELMASRNKVARRKGKGGAGDEVRYLANFTFPKCCILIQMVPNGSHLWHFQMD